MDEYSKQICSRLARLKSARTNFESHWTEVAELVRPDYSKLFSNGSKADATQGDKRNDKQFDATAQIACQRFASALESMLTPQGNKWHRLSSNDSVLRRDRATRLWFDDATEALFRYRYAYKANFTSQCQEQYLDLGAFGTGCMFTDQLAGEPGIRYRSIPLSDVYFEVNHQGIVDTVIRPFTMTARAVMQKWPQTAEKIVGYLAKSDPDKLVDVIHAVMPRTDFDPNRLDYKGMPFKSVYILKSGEVLLEEGGYNSFPYQISRYVTVPGEIYGRSPAMLALPSIKVLNEQKKTVLKQGQRVVDPVLLAHDDGVMDTFDLAPGAMNYGGVSADGRPLVHALPTGNLAIAKEMMEQERQIINDVFLVTLFQIMVETPQMTATEVIERTREKGALLSPTMGRQQTEFLGPLIDREVDLLMMQGLLPPMPPMLQQARGEYIVQYDSPLSRAQRSEEAAGTMRTLEYAANIASITQDPSVMDRFNFDVIVPELAYINAMPERFMASEEEVQAKRQGRQQQVASQQLVDAAPAIASIVTKGNSQQL